MELHLSNQERMDLLTVANQMPGYDDLERQLGSQRGAMSLQSERVIHEARDLAAQAVETNVPERHGLDSIKGVYDRASRMLFGEKMAKRLLEKQ